MLQLRSKIIGSGSYIPSTKIANDFFWNSDFYTGYDQKTEKDSKSIVDKFQEVAGIAERRYADANIRASDMATFAAQEALKNAGNLDPETLDYIIVSHNWGDVAKDNHFYDLLPNLAARVKHNLGIQNSNCVAYDLLFGCPGWLQGMIQADYYLRSGDAKRALVIGSDAVSRVIDSHDIDSMLFSDGAGAVVLEAQEVEHPTGIMLHKAVSDCNKELSFLKMDKSYNPSKGEEGLYLKMQGRNVFRYAMEKIPGLVIECLERLNLPIERVSKILMHQANAKMIRLIAERLFSLQGHDQVPEGVLPMNVSYIGNNSVATIPILYDMIAKGTMPEHSFKPGDILVMASVGAGMHINCVIYEV
jgi:3-oxoacyl-[acyl-carrier-protein] synthase-3